MQVRSAPIGSSDGTNSLLDCIIGHLSASQADLKQIIRFLQSIVGNYSPAPVGASRLGST